MEKSEIFHFNRFFSEKLLYLLLEAVGEPWGSTQVGLQLSFSTFCKILFNLSSFCFSLRLLPKEQH
jgi:hypothetical protein